MFRILPDKDGQYAIFGIHLSVNDGPVSMSYQSISNEATTANAQTQLLERKHNQAIRLESIQVESIRFNGIGTTRRVRGAELGRVDASNLEGLADQVAREPLFLPTGSESLSYVKVRSNNNFLAHVLDQKGDGVAAALQ